MTYCNNNNSITNINQNDNKIFNINNNKIKFKTNKILFLSIFYYIHIFTIQYNLKV
jgi:hypothetical protein